MSLINNKWAKGPGADSPHPVYSIGKARQKERLPTFRRGAFTTEKSG
jgi:hypothetical protein